MCTSPSHVWVKRGAEWVQNPVPCDRCWSCRENYVNDWVGRCLCEASTSTHVCTLSLTYADPADKNDLSHRVVNPHHFQLFIKRLRKAGHKIRYLAAGEYGDLRDRAHFHCILFFTAIAEPKKLPCPPQLMDRAAFKANPSIAFPFSRQIPQEEMVHISEWPHGHIKCDWSASERSVRYCCEYLYQDGKKTGWFSMSKKPPLGAAWFAEKARLSVQYDVFPATFEYLPPGGKPGKKYLMTGATRRDFLNLITTNRDKRPRMSKWVQATFDKLERQAFKDATEAVPPDGIDEFGLPFWKADQDYLDRQEPVGKVLWRILVEDTLAKQAADATMLMVARAWGFENVKEFQSFADGNGPQNHPEYFRGWPQHVQGSASDPLNARAASRSTKRPPDRFDRQGRPQWGPVDAEYLPTAFARPTDAPKPDTGEA